MNIIVSGKGMTVTPAMSAYVVDRTTRLERFWKSLIRCHVEVSRNRHHKHGEVFAAYVWIELPGNDIRVSGDGTTFEESIDTVYTKLERAIQKAKQKRLRV